MLKLKLELEKYSTDEIRHIMSLNVIYIFSAAIHIFFLILFIYYDIWELYVFNIISPFIYVICYLLNRRSKLVPAAAIAISEATLHGVLAVYLIGWQSGFHYYILLTLLLIYFLIKLNFTGKLILSLPVMFIYVGLYILLQRQKPVYDLDSNVILSLGILNISLMMVIICLFSLLYTYVVKRIEDTLRESEKIQKQLNFEKNKFISVFSHDLKDPVSALNGFSELMLTKYDNIDDRKKKMYLERIHISAQEIINQINNLTDWTRAQSGEVKISLTDFRLDMLFNEMFEIFEETRKTKEIKLSKQIHPDLMIHADYEMIRTVLIHMVSNGLKFTKPGGEVIMRGEKKNDHIEISVQDNGIGIPAEDLKRIFEIEHKMIRRGTQDETGTGLGLIICKEFVKMNDGTIFVESSEKKGTTSIIRLPIP